MLAEDPRLRRQRVRRRMPRKPGRRIWALRRGPGHGGEHAARGCRLLAHASSLKTSQKGVRASAYRSTWSDDEPPHAAPPLPGPAAGQAQHAYRDPGSLHSPNPISTEGCRTLRPYPWVDANFGPHIPVLPAEFNDHALTSLLKLPPQIRNRFVKMHETYDADSTPCRKYLVCSQ
jgi:hypothetical protein